MSALRRKQPKNYQRWVDMRSRCRNKKSRLYKYYGGRGIFVVPEWHVFENFRVWCEKTQIAGCSLDRINNDGPYAPWNCRWATHSEQVQNSRYTKKRRALTKRMQVAAKRALHRKYGNPRTRQYIICSTCREKQPIQNFRWHRIRRAHNTCCRDCTKIYQRLKYREYAKRLAAK